MAKITIDTAGMQLIGQNLLAAEVDGKIVLVIDPSAPASPSASGKMMMVAGTGGFAFCPGGKGNLKINFNLGFPNK